MNIRKAKRQHIGNYREEGFHFQATFPKDTTAASTDSKLTQFLRLIESLGLLTGCSSTPLFWDGLVHKEISHSKTTEEDKEAVRKMLLQLGANKVGTSINVDLWHNPNLLEKIGEPEKSPEAWTWETSTTM